MDSASEEKPLWLVIEAAYSSPTVNGSKYVHTVAAETATAACERVAKAIRERMDGDGRKLLDDGIPLNVVPWEAVATLTAIDRLDLRAL